MSRYTHSMKKILPASFAFVISLLTLFSYSFQHSTAMASDKAFVYVGTYTGEKSEGIYRFRLDLKTGETSRAERAHSHSA